MGESPKLNGRLQRKNDFQSVQILLNLLSVKQALIFSAIGLAIFCGIEASDIAETTEAPMRLNRYIRRAETKRQPYFVLF
jgi:hypothetical protein